MHPDANTLNATSYGLTLGPLMDAARSLLFKAQGTGGGDSGEDEEQGRLAQHGVHQLQGLQQSRAEEPRPYSGSQGTEQVNVQTFIDGVQASAVLMLWDELQLSTNEEIYMDFRLQGNGHEPGCSNETVATWTPGGEHSLASHTPENY